MRPGQQTPVGPNVAIFIVDHAKVCQMRGISPPQHNEQLNIKALHQGSHNAATEPLQPQNGQWPYKRLAKAVSLSGNSGIHNRTQQFSDV